MSRGRAARFLVGLLLVALLGLKLGSTSAQTPESLFSAVDYSFSVETLASSADFMARGPTGAPCVPFEFKTMIRQQFEFPPFAIPAENTSSSCATPTEFGYQYGKYLYDNAETLAGTVQPYDNLLALPHSDVLLAGVPNFNAHNVRVWTGYRPKEHKLPQDFGRIWYDLPGASGADNFITDKSGQRLPFAYNTIRSSSNGEWMIAYLPSISLVKVNTASLEVLPFGDLRGSTALAISNSGRFAAAFYTNDRSLMLFDLAGCSQVPDRIARGSVTCPSKNLAASLELDGQLENIRYLRFNEEDKLYIELEYKNPAGQLVKARADLAPGGVDVGGIDYIAMGDSFASGEGELDADWYELGTDVNPDNMCHLSRRSYPYLIANQLGLSESYSVACSGAVVRHVLNSAKYGEDTSPSELNDWHPGRRSQIDYMVAGKTDFLTISIGGNDVDFSNKLKSCVMSPGTCTYAAEDRANVAREIAAVHGDILEVYKKLAEKTEGRSKIYALGYPQFIQPSGGSCGANVGLLNEEERVFINQAVSYLNQVIHSAAEEAGVYYLDLENSLAGRNLCSGAPQSIMAFNGITAGNDNFGLLGNETYHPNHLGHGLFKSAIIGQTGNNPADFQICSNGANICPRGNGLIPLPDISYWGAEAQSYVSLMNDEQSLITELPPKHQPVIVEDQTYYQPGQEVRIVTGGFAPGTEVEIVLRSEPVVLAKAVADSNGFIDQTVKIPEDIEFGFHTLHLLGVNTVNQGVDYYESVPVFIPPPQGPVENPVAAGGNNNETDNTNLDVNSNNSEDSLGLLSFNTAEDRLTSSGPANDNVLADVEDITQNPVVSENNPSQSFAPILSGLMSLAVLLTVIIWKKAGSERF